MAEQGEVAPVIHPGAVITHGALEYTIGQQFDSGGFGTVFHAQRTKPTPRDVVVKVPTAHIIANPEYSAKFEREAAILANLSHINVVGVVAFWRFPSGEMALVQELVAGATRLTPYLQANPDEAPSVYLQALYALRAMHQGPNGAVHRDISPANILIDENRVVKVIDFGLAKEDPRVGQILTMTGEWFGTPGCMSPEQMLDAKTVDGRADLYALGRSMTAALQGRNPQHADPTALSEPWRSICMRLCRHDVEARYPSAQEAIEDAFLRFSSAGIALSDFALHVAERRWQASASTVGWPEVCRTHFEGAGDITQADLEIAGDLPPESFEGAFGANAFFDRVEAGSAIAAFNQETVPYEGTDALGSLYQNIYSHLDPPRRLRCFERLCRTAIRWHRYSVMGAVRSAYSDETDPAMQAQLIAILNAEDPGPEPTIHGRSVIPGRTP